MYQVPGYSEAKPEYPAAEENKYNDVYYAHKENLLIRTLPKSPLSTLSENFDLHVSFMHSDTKFSCSPPNGAFAGAQ